MWSALTVGVVLIAGVGVYAHEAILAIGRGTAAWLVVAGLPLVYLALVGLFAASYFALAWLYRSPRPPDARLKPAGTLSLVWHEYWTLAGAPLRMLFYRLLVRDPAPAPAALPVLLLHGVLCNAGVWARTVRFLRGHGVQPVYALSYGPPLASIEVFADQLHDRIEAIRAATGARQVFLVAHSMGGLVALAYVRKHGGAAVRTLVAIGTPFHGSMHANGFFGASLAQLRPGNPWLAALDARAPAGGPPVVSIWSWHDSMVAPQTSSRLTGATDVPLVGIGHNALLRDPAVLARVLQEYRAASALRATSECPASAERTPSARG